MRTRLVLTVAAALVAFGLQLYWHADSHGTRTARLMVGR